MIKTRRSVLAEGGAFVSAAAFGAVAQDAALSEDEILSIAKEAYIYGYSLIPTEYTRQ